jgi:hypothetical protein
MKDMIHMNSFVCVCVCMYIVFDVAPVDDKHHKRTICTAQACQLHDHILHELDQQFLNQAPILCWQEYSIFNYHPLINALINLFSVQHTSL